MTTLLLSTAAFTFVVMFLLWLLSLRLNDASIVDLYWGPGLALIAWLTFWLADGYRPRRLLLCTLVTIWGLRLALHLWWRKRGRGEDFRYQAMRKRHKERFKWVSMGLVFGLQGLLMWIVALPLQLAQTAILPWGITWLEFVGVGVWIIGFLCEAVGDWQLLHFKADPANRGKVLRTGLWRYSRHPNYFGDAVVWWGFWVMALAVGEGLLAILSPLLMTFMLLRVTGAALLEKSLLKTKPQYKHYVAHTSGFVPWPPKR